MCIYTYMYMYMYMAHENWRERSERSRIVLANFKWRERSIVPHDQNLHGCFIGLLSAYQMII